MNQSLVRTPQRGLLAWDGVTFAQTALSIRADLAFEDWQQLGGALRTIEGAVHWWLGDWLNYGERKYGEKYTQAVETTGFKIQTLMNDKFVAEHIEFSRRRENLTFGHHQEVASLQPDKQDEWLGIAASNLLSTVELRQQIRSARLANVNAIGGERTVRLIHGDMLAVVPTLGLFDLVVTDPPYGVVPKYDSVDPLEWDRFDDFLAQTRAWLDVVKAALKPQYNLFWFCAPTYAARVEQIFTEIGLPIQSRIIWHRRSIPKGRAAADRFISTWDMILHAGNRPLNFPAEWSDAWFDVQVFSQPLTSSNDIDQKIHETQKPSELIERLVMFGSFPGDRVLDPFAGSGVVGAVCPKDRECILIEREEVYIDRIEQRLGVQAED